MRQRIGSSKRFSGAPFAQELRGWFVSQKLYPNLKELAAASSINYAVLRNYFAGCAYPGRKNCQRLYEITGLDCLGPGAVAARALHFQLRRLPPGWTRDLLHEVHRYIETMAVSVRHRATLRTYATRVLQRAVEAGVSRAQDLTPEQLIRLRLGYKRESTERGMLTFFGHFLGSQGLWGPGERKRFAALIRLSAKTLKRSSRGPYAEFARVLQEWWDSDGERRFRTKRKLASAIGVSTRTVFDYFAGRAIPEREHCGRLYELSGIDCLFPSTGGRHVAWARQLIGQTHRYIAMRSLLKFATCLPADRPRRFSTKSYAA